MNENTLKFAMMSEKAINLIESQNKLVFIVDNKADKTAVKEAAEKTFESKVAAVRTSFDQRGRKKAYIKFKDAGKAGEIAIRLGII